MNRHKGIVSFIFKKQCVSEKSGAINGDIHLEDVGEEL